MKSLNAWYALFTGMGLLWHECGDDLGVFCYRIGCGVFTAARDRALELAPVAVTSKWSRINGACSNLSFTSSARFTNPRD
jgi:hypothetical protein